MCSLANVITRFLLTHSAMAGMEQAMKAMMKEIMKNSDQMPPGMLERLAEI